VKVQADSLGQVDYNEQKQEKVEMTNALATFLQSAATTIKAMPGAAPMIFEMMKFSISGFRGAQEMESVIDQGIQQIVQEIQQAKQKAAQTPPPEVQKAQMDMQMKQAEMQMKQQEHQMDMQFKAADHQQEMQQDAQQFEQSMVQAQQKAMQQMVADARRDTGKEGE
jgi:hypothetical protein